MTELLDSKLAGAGSRRDADDGVRLALDALVAQRAAASRPRRRMVLRPAVAIGVGLALVGTGAVAASQWGPWVNITDPDIVFSRSWTDVQGAGIGSCETRLATRSLSGEQLAVAQQFFANLDVDALEPNTENVATHLTAVGRPEDLSNLIEGADASDFDIIHTGPLWDNVSDARILQDGLEFSVFQALADNFSATAPELVNGLSAATETQCTSDPSPTGTP